MLWRERNDGEIWFVGGEDGEVDFDGGEDGEVELDGGKMGRWSLMGGRWRRGAWWGEDGEVELDGGKMGNWSLMRWSLVNMGEVIMRWGLIKRMIIIGLSLIKRWLDLSLIWLEGDSVECNLFGKSCNDV